MSASTRWRDGASSRPATPLTTNEAKLLHDIHEHPDSTVTQRYQRLNWNPKTGNNAQTRLRGKGLINSSTITTGDGVLRALGITNKGRIALGEISVERHGGPEHEYWKHHIAEQLRARGYTVTTERALGEGKTTDVYARNNDHEVFIEIETGRSDVANNILKHTTGTLIIFFTNSESATCYQGQTHGHEAFLLSPEEARAVSLRDASSGSVLKPYMTGDDLLANLPPGPQRFAIDFYPLTLPEAAAHKVLFEKITSHVLPDRERAAKEEQDRNDPALREDPSTKVNRHHRNFLNKWWHFSYPRGEMLRQIRALTRYIVCVRVTKRPIFVFVSPTVHPNDALTVFPLADDYSFGILQSTIHWEWFMERCSTLKRDPRYTSDTVFDSFPWPQTPTTRHVENVATAARHIRKVRSDVMQSTRTTLRELYRQMELPGAHPIKDAQAALDETVRSAYAMPVKSNTLDFLLDLNLTLAKREDHGEVIVGPGLPTSAKRANNLISTDRIEASLPFRQP